MDWDAPGRATQGGPGRSRENFGQVGGSFVAVDGTRSGSLGSSVYRFRVPIVV